MKRLNPTSVWMRSYRKNNPEKARNSRLKYKQNHKEQIRSYGRQYTPLYYKRKPWARTMRAIHTRCSNPKAINYFAYGARGIKNLITLKDLKQLWFRDKAYKMKQPSIDRINSNGNYELSNCRYIEKSENIRRSNRSRYATITGSQL